MPPKAEYRIHVDYGFGHELQEAFYRVCEDCFQTIKDKVKNPDESYNDYDVDDVVTSEESVKCTLCRVREDYS